MITIRSGRRAVQGLGAPWEAWAQIGEHGVIFGGWGVTRLDAEDMAVAALRRDLSAARAGYLDERTIETRER